MAQLLLIPLGQALGGAIGGSIATAIGGAIGGLAGDYIMASLAPHAKSEGPRLKTQQITASTEGSPINMLWGQMPLPGNVIWATHYEEVINTRTESAGGKGGPKVDITEYSYYANFAVGLCEGPISRIRLWADNKEIDQTSVTIRTYLGDEDQMPDELILAKEGPARVCAYRGTAYVVFDRLPIGDYGNRMPNIKIEAFRMVGSLEEKITAIAIHPDGGEFSLDTNEQTRRRDGEAEPENRHNLRAETDFLGAMDELEGLAPSVANVTISPQWFADTVNCGTCLIQPKVVDANNPVSWKSHTLDRSDVELVTKVYDQPLFGATGDDSAFARSVLELADRGKATTIAPKLVIDPHPFKTWHEGAIDDLVVVWSKGLGIFAGISAAGVGAVSKDGINWDTHSVPARDWSAIDWSPKLKMFVAVASDVSGSTIYTSYDGIDWDDRSTIAGDWQGVVWSEAKTRFVVIGLAAPNSAWSNDGITWTAGTAAVRNWRGITYSPSRKEFIALATNSTFMMGSGDGKTWSEHSTNVTFENGTNNDVVWSETHQRYCAIVDDSFRYIASSADGTNWTQHLAIVSAGTRSVAVAEGRREFLIYSGIDSTLYTTKDFVTYESYNLPGAYGGGHQLKWSPELQRVIISRNNLMAIGNPYYKPAIKRLTCSPAPGKLGTPNAGGDAVELAAQVDDFFGTVIASEITASVNPDTGVVTVGYTGSTEWSYRRFILHYAQLVAALNLEVPGAVDSFTIGTGLSGMTKLRSADNPSAAAGYLSTVHLISLATEISTILGAGVAVGYAADMGEHGALVLDDGRVGWPLDGLWSNADIDYVGINFTAPMSDWRAGLAHTDALGGAISIYDTHYLAQGIEGGEYFDWTYESAAERDSQTRTTITDAVVGKPWVFAKKDIDSFWGNQHFARAAADTEEVSATGWIAESKPLRISLNVSAIDNATNDLSAVFDPISYEHARPPYSSTARDDAIQRVAIEVFLDYWADPANNPTSAVYAEDMVDQGHLTLGYWDARPTESFPADGRYWADADNHEYGPWLNGRLGVADAAGVIRTVCSDFNFDAFQIEGLGAVVNGITGQGGNSARAIFEAIQPALLFDIVESGDVVRFQHRGGQVITVDPDQLVFEEGESLYGTQREEEDDLPLVVQLNFAETVTDGSESGVEAIRGVGGSDRTQGITLPVAMGYARAKALVEIILAEIYLKRDSMETTFPPSLMRIEAGDLISLIGHRGLWLVTGITDIGTRSATLIKFEPRIYTPMRVQRRSRFPVGTSREGVGGSAVATPLYHLMDMPLLIDAHDPDAGYVAAYMKPFGQGIAVYRSPSDTNYSIDQILGVIAIMGVTSAAFEPGVLNRWDNANTLEVSLYAGELSSTDELSVYGGANAVAVQNPDGEWEILQFENAELIGTRQYRLSKLLRGQRGTEHAMQSLAAGAPFVVLDIGVFQTGLSSSNVGQPLNWKLGPASEPVSSPVFTDETFAYTGKGRRPYSPVHLKAEASGADISLTWIRRSRIGSDSWDQVEIPLGEETEAYEIDVLDGATVIRTLATTTQNVTYLEAEQIADFGSVISSIDFNVYQLSTSFGRGIAGQYSGDVL